MARVAYRFLPCDEEGIPREHSQYTLVADAAEIFSTGSVIDSGVLGVAKCKWSRFGKRRGRFEVLGTATVAISS